uniref:hypothetical protein n=1 Tax=Flavobacterium sp. TaxID=239 RepID=UPI0040479DA5
MKFILVSVIPVPMNNNMGKVKFEVLIVPFSFFVVKNTAIKAKMVPVIFIL